MKPAAYLLLAASWLLGHGCVHGALKVAAGPGGPWIVANDGAIYAHANGAWAQQEPPGTADGLALCGTHLFVLTRPDASGQRAVRSRDLYGSSGWTTYPALGQVGLEQVACDGHAPVVLTSSPDMSVYRYDATQGWRDIHRGAIAISVENGRLFHLYPTTTTGNVWSRDVGGGPYTRWGTQLVAAKVAGDANGLPWVATSATSNPLYKWDAPNKKWTFGFASGPVYDMDVQDYSRMYILSDPAAGGGYTVYSHDLYSGGWTKYALPGN